MSSRDHRFSSDLSDITVMSPGGIPPWEPPEDDSGEWLAYEGWVEWVESNGTFFDRVQVLSYRFETAARTIVEAFIPATQKTAKAVGKFIATLNKGDD